MNQLGFHPNAQKIALVQGAVCHEDTLRYGTIVEVFDTVRHRVVLRVAMGTAVIDQQSGDTLRTLDFSILTTPSVYRLRYGGIESPAFHIGRGVYDQLIILMMRSYYLQRCGSWVRDTARGIIHAPCHLNDAIIARSDDIYKQGTHIHVHGGWHDAGDYGKYIATAAVSVAELLSLAEDYAEMFPHLFSDTTGIPESMNGIADVYDELKVALDWMLRMQRPDGAVFRKVSGASWSPLVAPDEERQTRYVYGISTPETAKFAGVMAHAARALRNIWQHYADTCLQAAVRAWHYLARTPHMAVDWQASDDTGSGKYLFSDVDTEYALTIDTDDRLYAATELFLTTRDSTYYQAVELLLQQVPDSVLFGIVEWKNMAPLAVLRILRHAPSLPHAVAFKQQLHRRAYQIEQRIEHSAYRYANERIVWGSNKMTAEEGVILLHAYHTGKHRRFLDGAQDQLDFLLGRNPQGLCFVSGIGSSSVQRICHTFARAKRLLGKSMIPGLLVGGANEMEQSGIAPKQRGLRSYADDERSYATNENAIDYNAAALVLAVRLIAEFEREHCTPARDK
ncbi:MAG: glycoside hydrolase family 9 protein [Bacteroidota bacterium]|nr:glycoside hydrolase family 9 protein [Bacteroidota bacterium]